MTTAADDLERQAKDIIVNLLNDISSEHGSPLAMLFAGTLVAAACAWVTKHHGPRAAFDLTQLVADEILEQRLKR